jgi:serine phosphatase RsbU (regulator of sigma subunit)
MDSQKNIELISRIGQKITSTLDLNEVIEALQDDVNTLMDVSGLIIYILNPALNSLELKYALGKSKNFISNSISMDNENSFGVYTVKNKAEILMNDVQTEYSKYISSFYWNKVSDEETVHSLINIPLVIRDRAFGFISVQSFKKHAYTKDHLEILKSLASYMSIAFNNADTYAQLDAAKSSINDQKKIIEQKNKDITDSINYAKRIQQAMLPKKEEIASSLPQSFVLFKPKDIVSGDFYFFRKINSSVIIAAADCTGHGVPGAFMSLIGSEKLEAAVSQSTDPSEILNLLNKGIRASLHQSEDDDSTRDGMDIALGCIDMNKHMVSYAGANRPLWIIRKGKKEIEEITATRIAIGGFTGDAQHFQRHDMKLEPGDTFYIATDGYADTFGGRIEKKLTTRRFKELLLSIQDKTMKEQETHLDTFIENWRGGTEQIDDILVIGVRL